MNRSLAVVRRRLAYVLAATLVLAACDDDPSRPDIGDLTADLTLVPESLTTQGAIRVRFNRPITANTALDPANFVVTDTCTGLRVPGTLRLEDPATIAFSPASALPYLSVLAVRLQNILDTAGAQLNQPVTFARTVQGPPVGDVSWDALNSPTSENLTGVSFVDPQLGYLLGNDGTVYRTQDGGSTFAAIFKDVTLSDAGNVRAFGDTLYMIAAVTQGSSSTGTLFRSTNGGLSFQRVSSNGIPLGLFASLSMRRAPGGQFVGLAAGNGTQPAVFRHESAGDTFAPVAGVPGAFTPDGLFRLALGVDLSRDTTKAILAIAAAGATGLVRGEAYRSTDGGRSFVPVALPTTTEALEGASFINNDEALVFGDSSTVIRVNVATGAATPLGAGSGIPQTSVDAVSGAVTSYVFFRADFTADGQTGWLVGSVIVDFPAAPDVIRGVILQTSDGGQSWTRQAIQNAPENGVSFPAVLDVQVLSADFAAISGASGLVAARRGGAPRRAAACAFTPS